MLPQQHRQHSVSPQQRQSKFRTMMMGRCFNCLGFDHKRAECRDPTHCWICKKVGHSSPFCKQSLAKSHPTERKSSSAPLHQPPPPFSASAHQWSIAFPSIVPWLASGRCGALRVSGWTGMWKSGVVLLTTLAIHVSALVVLSRWLPLHRRWSRTASTF
jgi:hypothetical protein